LKEIDVLKYNKEIKLNFFLSKMYNYVGYVLILVSAFLTFFGSVLSIIVCLFSSFGFMIMSKMFFNIALNYTLVKLNLQKGVEEE